MYWCYICKNNQSYYMSAWCLSIGDRDDWTLYPNQVAIVVVYVEKQCFQFLFLVPLNHFHINREFFPLFNRNMIAQTMPVLSDRFLGVCGVERPNDSDNMTAMHACEVKAVFGWLPYRNCCFKRFFYNRLFQQLTEFIIHDVLPYIMQKKKKNSGSHYTKLFFFN